MKVLGSIEARMGSSRLAGKTLMGVWDGRLLLDLVVSRFRRCRTVDQVQVATTDQSRDDLIADWCRCNNVACFRGSEQDVLDRVAKAAASAGADVVVQMGGDSAYLDFSLIDQLVEEHRAGKWDYVCNDLEPGYPLGIYGHVVAADVLAALTRRTDLSPADRDDVVRYIWEHPNEYRIRNLAASSDYAAPQLRLTIDYPEDMDLARAVYAHFGRDDFSTQEVIALSRSRPELFAATLGLKQRSAPFLKKSG